MPYDEEEITRLEKLIADATPLPWKAVEEGSMWGIEAATDIGGLGGMGRHDAEAIVALRTEAPKLLAEIRRLQDMIEMTKTILLVRDWDMVPPDAYVSALNDAIQDTDGSPMVDKATTAGFKAGSATVRAQVARVSAAITKNIEKTSGDQAAQYVRTAFYTLVQKVNNPIQLEEEEEEL